jgi:HK97 family phage major capsid protein
MPGKLRLPSVPGAIIGYRKDGRPIRLAAGGDETHDLTGQLETRRSALITANREILSAASAANEGAGRATTADEDQRYGANMTEIRALNQRLDDLGDQAARDERARQHRADGTTGTADDHGSGARASGVQVTSEPQTYGRYSPHSYWADLARDKFGSGDGGGGVANSRERLRKHAAELEVELPKRQERRNKLADTRIAEVLEQQVRGMPARMRRREERMIERFLGSGLGVFERRAISRTDGTGGYFVPPLWLIDEYVPYLRAGRVLADQCHSMPLPSGTDSINLPRITTGTATGAQTADGAAVPSQDLADNYVNALVRTVAGQEDAAMQLLDQSPIGVDEVVMRDLAADHAMQIDGQVLLGSGLSGQVTGMFPNGTITGSPSGKHVDTVTGTTTAQWVGTNSFYQGAGKIMSQISRNRFRPVTAVLTNPAVWFALATAADGNSRPLVVPSIQGPWNAAADFGDNAGAEGLVGSVLGRPWYVDNNIPLTFGGATTSPSMTTVSAGHVAPTDGTGTGNNFTPFLAGVWDDLLLFEGEVRTRVLQEILSGTLQIRFQIYSYWAFMPNRYQDASSVIVSYGNANSGTTAGAALSTGIAGGLVGF